MTLAQFCRRYNLDRSTVFKLRRDGLGPDEIQIGRKILITHRAAVEWELQMTLRSNELRGVQRTHTPAPPAVHRPREAAGLPKKAAEPAKRPGRPPKVKPEAALAAE
ncbi:hypothetical protein [Cupriavidus metallidurans]|nr:hypothetical protein [Cupriavidus metallidurans]QGS30215.1 hypothetical protein FOB83_15700 [Cupriavidus metallidurans]